MLAPLNFVSDEYPFLVCVPKSAAPAGNWTQDLLLSGQMPYQLSYRGSWEFSVHDALVFCWSAMVWVQPARWQHLPIHNTPYLHYFFSPTVLHSWQLLCLLVLEFCDCNMHVEPHSSPQLAFALPAWTCTQNSDINLLLLPTRRYVY